MRGGKKRPAVIIAAVCAALLLAAAIGYVYLRATGLTLQKASPTPRTYAPSKQ